MHMRCRIHRSSAQSSDSNITRVVPYGQSLSISGHVWKNLSFHMAYGVRKMAIEIVLEMAGDIYKYNMFSDVIKNRFGLSSLTMLLALGLIFSTVISSIHASPLKRSLPSGVVTCGSNRYTVSAITAAIDAGVNDMDEGVYPGIFLV